MNSFTREEIQLLAQEFQLDDVLYRHRYRTTPETALCLVLMRLSYPRRLWEFQNTFGHSVTWISVVFTDTVLFLARRYKQLLQWHPILTPQRIHAYSQAIRGLYDIDSFWGFVDGSFQGFSRPQQGQRLHYSGYKKRHGQKWQAVVAPDGLIVSLFGPYEGPANDHTMARESGLEARCQAVSSFYLLFYLLLRESDQLPHAIFLSSQAIATKLSRLITNIKDN